MSYQQPYGGYPPPPQPQYNQQPQYPPYGQPQYQQSPPPPPQSGYSYPPPATNYPALNPPWVPQGWTALWEPSVQRWWYLDLISRQAQLEPPSSTFSPPPPVPSRDGLYNNYPPPQGPPPGQYNDSQADSGRSDKTNMLIGAAGGLAVGAVGGALIAEALGSCFAILIPTLPFQSCLIV